MLPTEPELIFASHLHTSLTQYDMAAVCDAPTPTAEVAASDGAVAVAGMQNVLALPARACTLPSSHCERVGAVSLRGRNPAAVKINQDALLIAEHTDSGSVLLAVFDGHGQYGREVSQYLRTHLPALLFGSAQFETACSTASDIRRRADAGVHSHGTFSALRHRSDRAVSDVEVLDTDADIPLNHAMSPGSAIGARRTHVRISPLRSRSARVPAYSTSSMEAAVVLADLTEARAVCEVLAHTLLVLESQMLGTSGINCALSGATATVVLLRRGFLHSVNVGDSRAILVTSRDAITRIDSSLLASVCAHVNKEGGQGSSGAASPTPRVPSVNVDTHFLAPEVSTTILTVDHKPDLPRERQRIIACGGRVQATKLRGTNQFVGPQRVWLKASPMPGLNMSRSIGDLIGKQAGVISSPYKVVRPLNEHDCALVLASDGIWDWVASDEAASLALSSLDCWEAAMRLARLARARWLVKTSGGADDTSVIIARLSSPAVVVE